MSQLKKEKIPHAIRSKTSTCHHKNLAQLNKYFFKKLSGNMEITGNLDKNSWLFSGGNEIQSTVSKE